jgi:SOS-response transcriptional repressor LexA
MGWADVYVRKLQDGETVQFRPRGNSMHGRITSGQLVTVEPITSFESLERGEIVLCRVSGAQYLHLIKSIDPAKKRVLICNNRGGENGWTTFNHVYGRVTEVKP